MCTTQLKHFEGWEKEKKMDQGDSLSLSLSHSLNLFLPLYLSSSLPTQLCSPSLPSPLVFPLSFCSFIPNLFTAVSFTLSFLCLLSFSFSTRAPSLHSAWPALSLQLSLLPPSPSLSISLSRVCLAISLPLALSPSPSISPSFCLFI